MKDISTMIYQVYQESPEKMMRYIDQFNYSMNHSEKLERVNNKVVTLEGRYQNDVRIIDKDSDMVKTLSVDR